MHIHVCTCDAQHLSANAISFSFDLYIKPFELIVYYKYFCIIVFVQVNSFITDSMIIIITIYCYMYFFFYKLSLVWKPHKNILPIFFYVSINLMSWMQLDFKIKYRSQFLPYSYLVKLWTYHLLSDFSGQYSIKDLAQNLSNLLKLCMEVKEAI